MNLRHVVSLLPTPRASQNENRQTRRTPSQEAGRHGKSLAAEVGELLPTPTVADSNGTRNHRPDGTPYANGYGRPLTDATMLLPTPAPTSASTHPPSHAGKTSSDAPLPGQLTLWDG